MSAEWKYGILKGISRLICACSHDRILAIGRSGAVHPEPDPETEAARAFADHDGDGMQQG